MCWYKIAVCPYPHREPISASIFNPSNVSRWEHCDKPHPWGRLSCGNLVVEHPEDLFRYETQATFAHILGTRSNLPAEGENQQRATFSVRQRRSSTETTIVPGGSARRQVPSAPCPWCTAILKTVATKSKEIHEEARKEIDRLEEKMDISPGLRQMQREIQDKEHELDDLRHVAWKKAKDLLDRRNGEDESDRNGRTQG
ncbi:hypothetical protein A1O1_06013 [Capronia coronata CBS 617.96]|uniref:Uncharacterized protein n=1 Tax=Capronia coronata CBS 617.96 TaxID=1182541 RepID=W9XYL7_9EURO|nr:uncharacterized protein A1O1_06013 [Capronia coronata CBS 617.96]EXJ85647.1 hypothetical protein A1O1_06013 [Capronia coronata CBS 617.96]